MQKNGNDVQVVNAMLIDSSRAWQSPILNGIGKISVCFQVEYIFQVKKQRLVDLQCGEVALLDLVYFLSDIILLQIFKTE